MATSYEKVGVADLREDGSIESSLPLGTVRFDNEKQNVRLGDSENFIAINKDLEVARVGGKAMVLSTGARSLLITFNKDLDANSFHKELTTAIQAKQKGSIFEDRTDASSAEQYFQFYGYLSQQQNMMQDYVRTSTYQRAMLNNCHDFQDKIVLDVGAGSGILSFFAIQAGAKKVYAIEASSMALQCQRLVETNKLGGRIEVIPGKIEEIELPEHVDIIISEPMGYMLFNERMLETYLHAKKWLRPGGAGQMFPTQGDLHIAPFTDEALFMEQFSKANFWYQQSFHGVDLSGLRQAAVQEYFKQPIVDTFDIRICLARSHKYTVDFQSAHEQDLHHIEIPVSFTMLQAGTVHGLAFWFDVAFIGSQSTVWLSTAPTQPLTHWYQVRCLLETPVFVKLNQTLAGKVVLRSNKRQSYDVEIELTVPGTANRSSSVLDLKNPFFRYTGQAPQPPPGTNTQSPSEAYWNGQDPSGSLQQDYQVQVVEPPAAPQLAYTVPVAPEEQPLVLQQQPAPPLAAGAAAALGQVAPINPGSIPSVGAAAGAGMSPIAFIQSDGGGDQTASPQQQASSKAAAAASYPVSNRFMIGDYAVPGGVVLPNQVLRNNCSSKIE